MSIYRVGSGAIMLPSWPESRTIAVADYRPASRRVEIAWLSGVDAVAYLEAASELFLEGEDMTPLTNQHHEVTGFVTPEPAELRAIPVAVPYRQELTERHRNFTMCDWRLGTDALIQAVSFAENEEEVCTDSVSGSDAWHRIISLACDPRAELYGEEDCVYGLVWPDGSREEFWDCDEMSYSVFLENLAEVIQEWEDREKG